MLKFHLFVLLTIEVVDERFSLSVEISKMCKNLFLLNND